MKGIVELGDQKIDELMTTSANINWLPPSASTTPRDYVNGNFFIYNLIFYYLACIGCIYVYYF